MTTNQDSLHTLNEIRDLMERSSRFLSLSGLSGVFAGLFALAGALVAYIRYKTDWLAAIQAPFGPFTGSRQEVTTFLLADGFLVLLLSLTTGIFLTVRKARRKGFQVWNRSSKLLLMHILVPLSTGGVFCLAMFYYGYIWLVFPATLLFYGLALVSASRFTYPEVFYLGISEIAIGSISLFLTGYALLFWSIGFGVLHIAYGLAMYNKYDRGETRGTTTKKGGLAALALILVTSTFCSAQNTVPALDNKARQWYDKETIYLQGSNSYIKNNMLYSGQKSIRKEFMVSEGGLQLYLKSRRTKNIALVISLAGSAGSIVSLVTGNRDALRKFFWVSVGTGIVSSAITMRANNLRDQAVWLRNRDAMLFMEANE